MASIDISIAGQKYVLKGEDAEEHLKEVADLVKRKVDSLRKEKPSAGLQKVAMLIAFDFASQCIKGKRRVAEYRKDLLAKAQVLLDRVESELAASQSSLQ